jgi:hypothetical protein
MNEPRNERPYPLGAEQIQAWINDVAPYLKSLAPNQLVTVGEDGFYQTANCQSNQCAPKHPHGGNIVACGACVLAEKLNGSFNIATGLSGLLSECVTLLTS